MTSDQDVPLKIFRPTRRVGIFVSYGLLALAGTVVIAFVANHAYLGPSVG